MPDGSLVLVFDDGYAEDHDQLRPILQSHDAPATLAVVPNWIGDDDHLDSDQLGELIDGGCEVLSHGRRHRYLQSHHLAADAAAGDERIVVEAGHVFPGESHGTLAGDEYELVGNGKQRTNAESPRNERAVKPRATRVTLTGTGPADGETVAVEISGELDESVAGDTAVLRPAGPTLLDEIVGVREAFETLGYDPTTFVFPYDAADARAWQLVREEYDAVANAAVRSLPNPPGTEPTNFRRYYLETTHSRLPEIETYLDHIAASGGVGILAGHSAWDSVPPERVAFVIEAARERDIEVTTFDALADR